MSKLSPSEVEENEKQKLAGLKEIEANDFAQWRCHVMNISLVGLALAVNLLRGTPKMPSIININKCGFLDWAILAGFIAFATSMTFV